MLGFSIGFGLTAFNIFAKYEGVLRYVATILLALVSILAFIYALVMLITSAGMNYGFKTYKDTNPVVNNINIKVCGVCGRKVGKNAKFCDYCGERLDDIDETKTCPKCKSKNRLKADYCSNCGNKFEEE